MHSAIPSRGCKPQQGSLRSAIPCWECLRVHCLSRWARGKSITSRSGGGRIAQHYPLLGVRHPLLGVQTHAGFVHITSPTFPHRGRDVSRTPASWQQGAGTTLSSARRFGDTTARARWQGDTSHASRHSAHPNEGPLHCTYPHEGSRVHTLTEGHLHSAYPNGGPLHSAHPNKGSLQCIPRQRASAQGTSPRTVLHRCIP